MKIEGYENGFVIRRNNKRVCVLDDTDIESACNIEIHKLTGDKEVWSFSNFERGVSSFGIKMSRETAFDLLVALMHYYDGFKPETDELNDNH